MESELSSHSIHRVGFLAQSTDMLHLVWMGMIKALNRNGRFIVSRAPLTENTVDTIRNWKPDVVIGHIAREENAELARRLKLPVLNTSGMMAHPPFPTVTINNRRTGEMAADHLLSKMHKNFAYIGTPNFAFSEARYQGFRTRIEMAGYEVARWPGIIGGIGMHDPERFRHRAMELRDWVLSLPEPLGVMTVDDYQAIAFIDHLRLVDENLLSRISLISGHHSALPFSPSISGVDQREMVWGMKLGEMVMRIALENGTVPSLTELEPAGIVEQESSAGVSTDDHDVLHAARYIRQSVQLGINVKDVVENGLGLGRRALERRFQNVMGHTILEEIQRARMDRARKLLREGEGNLQDVALQSGFTDHKHLQRVFTEREGITPGAYRKQNLPL